MTHPTFIKIQQIGLWLEQKNEGWVLCVQNSDSNAISKTTVILNARSPVYISKDQFQLGTIQSGETVYSAPFILRVLEPKLEHKKRGGPIPKLSPPTFSQRMHLYHTMRKHLNLEELKDICFELSYDYEDLPGETKKQKIQQLINYCYRFNLIIGLIEICQNSYRRVDWVGKQEEVLPESSVEQQQFAPFTVQLKFDFIYRNTRNRKPARLADKFQIPIT